MTVKLLTEYHLEFLSLKGGFTGSSESTLVKMPHCWKSHVTAHIHLHVDYYRFYKEYIRNEYQFNLFDLIMIALAYPPLICYKNTCSFKQSFWPVIQTMVSL